MATDPVGPVGEDATITAVGVVVVTLMAVLTVLYVGLRNMVMSHSVGVVLVTIFVTTKYPVGYLTFAKSEDFAELI
jgi:hypothetical protein